MWSTCTCRPPKPKRKSLTYYPQTKQFTRPLNGTHTCVMCIVRSARFARMQQAHHGHHHQLASQVHPILGCSAMALALLPSLCAMIQPPRLLPFLLRVQHFASPPFPRCGMLHECCYSYAGTALRKSDEHLPGSEAVPGGEAACHVPLMLAQEAHDRRLLAVVVALYRSPRPSEHSGHSTTTYLQLLFKPCVPSGALAHQGITQAHAHAHDGAYPHVRCRSSRLGRPVLVVILLVVLVAIVVPSRLA